MNSTVNIFMFTALIGAIAAAIAAAQTEIATDFPLAVPILGLIVIFLAIKVIRDIMN